MKGGRKEGGGVLMTQHDFLLLQSLDVEGVLLFPRN